MIFYACKSCWYVNSGYLATIVDGKKFRPVAWFVDKTANCHFCRLNKVGVFRYVQVDEPRRLTPLSDG